jgi:hypothetical protein
LAGIVLLSNETVGFTTAIWAAVSGWLLTEAQTKTANHALAHDLATGFLKRVNLPPDQWFPQAQRITARGTSASICRALAVLHVAADNPLRQAAATGPASSASNISSASLL